MFDSEMKTIYGHQRTSGFALAHVEHTLSVVLWTMNFSNLQFDFSAFSTEKTFALFAVIKSAFGFLFCYDSPLERCQKLSFDLIEEEELHIMTKWNQKSGVCFDERETWITCICLLLVKLFTSLAVCAFVAKICLDQWSFTASFDFNIVDLFSFFAVLIHDYVYIWIRFLWHFVFSAPN